MATRGRVSSFNEQRPLRALDCFELNRGGQVVSNEE